MKFNELTIRELRAEATAVCLKVIRLLPEEQKAMYRFLTVDYIQPMAMDDEEDWETFSVLGHITLDDGSKYGSTLPFKADMVWLGDGCDLTGPDDSSVEFDIDIDSVLE